MSAIALGLSISIASLSALSTPAVSQETATVTVTIDDAYAALVAQALDIPEADVPDTVVVSAEDAALLCGAIVEPGGTCTASASPETLSSYLGSAEEPSENGASALAPGQLKGDGESAKEYAPGHNKGDGKSAKDAAPGQVKKQ